MGKYLIVGYGNIGQKLYKEYAAICPDRYDPYKEQFEKLPIIYDIAFICVDTPMMADGTCDLSQVHKAIAETDAEIIVLRSTVPPGTTQKLSIETKKNIVFCPEFYGVTQHSDMSKFDFGFTILGGEKSLCHKVIQALQDVYDARHKFNITDPTTAELVKYMENTMLATKVSMCIQFWEICNEFKIDYNELRELLLNDPRINRAHTFVYDEHPYWKSHCFDKDLAAIAQVADAPLIKAVIDYNERCKKRYEKERD